MHSTTRNFLAGVASLALAADASAATGTTVEQLVIALLAVGCAFWLAFAFIGPFRRSLLRIPRNASRRVLFILAAVALCYAAGSAALGKTWLGSYVVLRAVEPNWFWLLVKFQAGVGVALLILGLLAPKRAN